MADEAPVWMGRREARRKKRIVYGILAAALAVIAAAGLWYALPLLSSSPVVVPAAQWYEGRWVLPDADSASNVGKANRSDTSDTVGGIESIIPKTEVVSYIPAEMKIATTRFVLFYKAVTGEVLSEEYRICSQKEANNVVSFEGEHIDASSGSLDIFARPTLTLKVRRDGDYNLFAAGLTTWSEKETQYKRNR